MAMRHFERCSRSPATSTAMPARAMLRTVPGPQLGRKPIQRLAPTAARVPKDQTTPTPVPSPLRARARAEAAMG